MSTRIAIAIFAAAAVVLFFWLRRGDITGEQARELVGGGAKLVDVRSPEEFAAGHLPGAVNIPVGELADRATEIGSSGTPVVVYCRSGARSSRAASILAGAGFTTVRNLGAMGRW